MGNYRPQSSNGGRGGLGGGGVWQRGSEGMHPPDCHPPSGLPGQIGFGLSHPQDGFPQELHLQELHLQEFPPPHQHRSSKIHIQLFMFSTPFCYRLCRKPFLDKKGINCYIASKKQGRFHQVDYALLSYSKIGKGAWK